MQDSAPVSDSASAQTTGQAPEGVFVASPIPEDVAAAEPGQAEGIAFAPGADQVLDAAYAQETAPLDGTAEVQDAGPTHPVPTGVETPLSSDAEPLAAASDTAQPAPTAYDSAPLTEGVSTATHAIPAPAPDAAHPDNALTPVEAVPAPIAEASPALLDATPDDP
ncbi:hypothetical protein R6V09_52895, partial [Streptomyces sp. W16]|nr:hypothetical protein [Streptomyces sp. W16]